MIDVVSLFDAEMNLEFDIADTKEDADDSSLLLVGAAKDGETLVGVGLSLSLLNGQRVIHPASLVSIGQPTDSLTDVLSKKWKVSSPATHVASREVRMTAQAVRRATPSRHGLRFTLKDLRWELGVFRFFCTRPVPEGAPDSFDPCLTEAEVELDRDNSRFRVRVTGPNRQNLIHFLTGSLQSAQ